jgi:hypothetical protein
MGVSRNINAKANPMTANNQFNRPVAVRKSIKKPIRQKITIFVYFDINTDDVFKNDLPVK